MRNSLGEKRKELSTDHIAEITELYGDFTDSDRVEILPNDSFGFLRVTVERPLRPRWEITDDTLAAVRADKKLAKLHPDDVDTLVKQLAEHTGVMDTDRKVIAKVIDPILKTIGPATPQTRAIWAALAVQDPDAPVIADRKGEPEPDRTSAIRRTFQSPPVPRRGTNPTPPGGSPAITEGRALGTPASASTEGTYWVVHPNDLYSTPCGLSRVASPSPGCVVRRRCPCGQGVGLVKHLAFFEASYLGFVFDRPYSEPSPPWTPERPKPESDVPADEAREQVIESYRKARRHADETIEALSLDAVGHVPWWGSERCSSLQRDSSHAR